MLKQYLHAHVLYPHAHALSFALSHRVKARDLDLGLKLRSIHISGRQDTCSRGS